MDRNFEQEYKKAFEAAKGLHEAGNALTKKQMEIVFPQLAESEDEKIRKELVAVLEDLILPDDQKRRFLAYLEKQKEQKPVEWSEEDEEVMEDLYNFVISDFIQDHIHETRWKPWKTTLERNRQNRLKSIRPVSKESLQSWKPSEEQMKALLGAEGIVRVHDTKELAAAIAELYEQLKRLHG